MSREYTAKAIEKARKERNMKQSELARAVGVSRTTMSQWEKGQAFPRIDYLQKLAVILNVDPSIFIGAKKEGKKSGLYVIATAAKGTWKDDQAADYKYVSPILPDDSHPLDAQYCISIGDNHAKQRFAKGAILHCLDYNKSGTTPADGAYVLITNEKADMVEYSVARIAANGDDLKITWLDNASAGEQESLAPGMKISAKIIAIYSTL